MKETIVFIHGLTGSRKAFKKQIDYFSHFYNTHAYDLLGHGENLDKTTDFTLHGLVSQLEQLFEQKEITKAHLCSISYGCYPATIFAVKRKEKVQSLCYIGGHYNSDSPLSYVLRHFKENSYSSYSDWLKRYSRDLFPNSSAVDPYAIISTRIYYRYGLHLKENILKRAIDHRLDYDLKKDLKQITVPVLWVMGDHDNLFKSSIIDLDEVIPHVFYKEIPHTGHAANMFRPFAFRRLYAEFLRKGKGTR
ncbi:alpha/beta fold hydrolase [Bacillus mangrovi]|uniref:Alpha/beta fold hydrolase n=1 Tax=Metabacillus mangrovi TaxID=1491830 RepID=A0A7X2V5Z0_9BACI|nr:alpha/beta hydrolase [Metabacillus mangrovi]MTH54691.1 alpha/beta fold hydrolase [Metabacillus mangrovi]